MTTGKVGATKIEKRILFVFCSHLSAHGADCLLAGSGQHVLKRIEQVRKHGAEVAQQAYEDEDNDNECNAAELRPIGKTYMPCYCNSSLTHFRYATPCWPVRSRVTWLHWLKIHYQNKLVMGNGTEDNWSHREFFLDRFLNNHRAFISFCILWRLHLAKVLQSSDVVYNETVGVHPKEKKKEKKTARAKTFQKSTKFYFLWRVMSCRFHNIHRGVGLITVIMTIIRACAEVMSM